MAFNDYLTNFECNEPAAALAIAKFESESGIQLPEEYAEFLRRHNGGEGFIGTDVYAMLWRVEELMEFNQEYEAPEFAPGFLLFGSNGGGEAFAFDLRSESKPIVSIPFIGMSPELAIPMGASFSEFLNQLYHTVD